MRIKHLLSMATLLLLHVKLWASPPVPANETPRCPAAQLSFAIDNENGYFDGMSHSGTLLVVRNLGPNACTIPARPVLSMEDASHHPLPISFESPRGMHPGPVIPPVVIPVGAEVTSEMRWVSSDAFGGNNSVSPAFIALTVEGTTLRVKFTGELFGPPGKQPAYSVTLFKRDPELPASPNQP